MKKNRSIPDGYMTVGELAGKMGTTVRTLQYYDKKGLLSPTAESSGGRRLYTPKDMIRLHQIMSLKSLGFSLDDIKNRLITLDSPAEIACILTNQAAAIRKKIALLSMSLNSIEALKTEVLQMKTVDFKKYADIIVNLQMENESYGLIKYFDDQLLDHIRTQFDMDGAQKIAQTFTDLCKEADRLQGKGIPPESPQAQALAERFWSMVIDFTGGDMDMISKLIEMNGTEIPDGADNQQMAVNTYIGPALDIYFTRLNIDPFKEEEK